MNPSVNVLLIDDNRTWRDTLAEYLEAKGFRVCAAEEALRGLDLLERQDFAVAVIDFNMPGMNGLELLRRLRHRHRRPAVLLLTSEDDPSLPSRALAEGAKAFLSKTTPPRRLLQALRDAILKYGREAAAASADRLLPVPVRRGITLPVPIWFYRPNRAG
jgi:DNA-binding NarL/FixJ family response regulator